MCIYVYSYNIYVNAIIIIILLYYVQMHDVYHTTYACLETSTSRDVKMVLEISRKKFNDKKNKILCVIEYVLWTLRKFIFFDQVIIEYYVLHKWESKISITIFYI